ncbi:serine/threonine-protein kinase [Kitasatospora sp. SUK 42]|uniref:serine/threonine-protein kinase n=1 Tax=Kitasatospora sp. SUK 42 TaxID=1588882 RepID=UPI001C311D74|nr:serine/threonine-protein kinase [Kitasatospora sp. SUK 42]MBV2151999.1 serine/threonine-protein kinase [Kitasatospora sp. SUK 42]
MRVGDVLDGRYELVEKLGQGGFGVVWRAEDTRMHRSVAVKVIRHHDGDQAKDALRFVREANAAGRLSHPHIVTVHDLGQSEFDDQPVTFLVMELLTGRTLTQVLREGLPAPEQSLRWGKQICEALAAAHDAGMVHRDIKPDNIMISDAGHLKVLDFGIAQLDTGGGGLTTVGTVIGSPPYMAPERWTGDRVDGRADLYALGCVLVELCTGARPFGGDSTPVLMYQHLNEPPPVLDPVRYGLPSHLPVLLAELLSKDPQDRPADARAVARRLADLAEGRNPPSAPIAPPTRRAPTRPVRHRGQSRQPKQPKLRPVGRPPLVLPEPAWLARSGQSAQPARPASPAPPPVPVEDQAAVRGRLRDGLGAARQEGSAAAAARLLRPVVDGAARALGVTDPEVVAARRDLAAHLGLAGEQTEAVRRLRELVEDMRQALGPTDPGTLEVWCDLARRVRDNGETVTAIRLLTELLPALRDARGPRGALVLQARHDLAACRAQRGDFQGAVLELSDLLPQLVEVLGEHDERCTRAAADLAEYRDRARRPRPGRAVRAWRLRIDRGEAEQLIRRIRAANLAGRSYADPSRALERGTGVRGAGQRVVAAPSYVSDEDLVEELFGP